MCHSIDCCAIDCCAIDCCSTPLTATDNINKRKRKTPSKGEPSAKLKAHINLCAEKEEHLHEEKKREAKEGQEEKKRKAKEEQEEKKREAKEETTVITVITISRRYEQWRIHTTLV